MKTEQLQVKLGPRHELMTELIKNITIRCAVKTELLLAQRAGERRLAAAIVSVTLSVSLCLRQDRPTAVNSPQRLLFSCAAALRIIVPLWDVPRCNRGPDGLADSRFHMTADLQKDSYPTL